MCSRKMIGCLLLGGALACVLLLSACTRDVSVGGAAGSDEDRAVEAHLDTTGVSSGARRWVASYGGTGSDWVEWIVEKPGGGYILAAGSDSFGAGLHDYWVLSLSADGNLEWQEAIGGSSREWPESAAVAPDGGSIIAGQTYSFGSGGSDAWLVRIDGDGEVIWEKAYGGGADDWAVSVASQPSGTYVVYGGTASWGVGKTDILLFEVDAVGEVLWEKRYGGPGDDAPVALQQLEDGGFLLTGATDSFGSGGVDAFALRLDEEGQIVWESAYGGAADDYPWWAGQTSDGGFVLAGGTYSFGAGEFDAWLVRLDSSGQIEWQKTYGGTANDWFVYVSESDDGELVAIGAAAAESDNLKDVWLVTLDSAGSIVSQCGFGGESSDAPEYACQLADGTYILAGRSVSFGRGIDDCWVVKLDEGACEADDDCATRDVVLSASSEAQAVAVASGFAVQEPTERTLVMVDTAAVVTSTEAQVQFQCPE